MLYTSEVANNTYDESKAIKYNFVFIVLILGLVAISLLRIVTKIIY